MQVKVEKWKAVYVLFRDDDNFWILKGLKKGCRHCSLLLQNHDGFLFIDPLLGWTQIAFIKNKQKNLFKKFEKEGYEIMEAKFFEKSEKLHFYGFFCTGQIKRILGLRQFWILTPWQLKLHLMVCNNSFNLSC